ncbi:MAG: sigma-70 family RNA polymerase sigma factor [Pirellulales bacterium]|nr:sigma-70 family RNA polymerase sigma factor [Pirellulales bacterium]
MDRLRRQEATAYGELVRDYGPKLLAVIGRYIHCESTAQDVLQEAFISAFRGLANFQAESTLGTWLHRIAVNAALMKLRGQKRHPETAIGDLLPQYLPDGHRLHPGPAWNASSLDGLVTVEMRQLVRRAVDQLPESYRTVILLRDLEERSTAETADLLMISEGVVKTRLHRARQALREILDRHFQGEAV